MEYYFLSPSSRLLRSKFHKIEQAKVYIAEIMFLEYLLSIFTEYEKNSETPF